MEYEPNDTELQNILIDMVDIGGPDTDWVSIIHKAEELCGGLKEAYEAVHKLKLDILESEMGTDQHTRI